MIIRAWRGYATLGHEEAYPRHLLQTVRPKLEALSGFGGLYLLRRRDSTEVEFQVLTLWNSMEDVQAFAGADLERAVVEPEAETALVRFDASVRHYEVLARPGGFDPEAEHT
jgi:heme-degrading monooxygenase HmoA